jgi:hypothetical protein
LRHSKKLSAGTMQRRSLKAFFQLPFSLFVEANYGLNRAWRDIFFWLIQADGERQKPQRFFAYRNVVDTVHT